MTITVSRTSVITDDEYHDFKINIYTDEEGIISVVCGNSILYLTPDVAKIFAQTILEHALKVDDEKK